MSCPVTFIWCYYKCLHPCTSHYIFMCWHVWMYQSCEVMWPPKQMFLLLIAILSSILLFMSVWVKYCTFFYIHSDNYYNHVKVYITMCHMCTFQNFSCWSLSCLWNLYNHCKCCKLILYDHAPYMYYLCHNYYLSYIICLLYMLHVYCTF